MLSIQRIPDSVSITTVDKTPCTGAALSFDEKDGCLSVYLTGAKQCPAWVELRWNTKLHGKVLLLGDAWERAYADLSWRGIEHWRAMPWYFLAHTDGVTTGCGVKVRPGAFVSFSVDSEGVTAKCDVRCGTDGVELGGRKLHVADFVSRTYTDMSAYKAAQSFCSVMCTDAILPESPVYGGNNWYYAYGESSFDDIMSDTRLQARLAKGLKNRPFMTIDDGWQKNKCTGPWIPNRAFGDMKKTADEIRSMDVRPGIWIRYLHDDEFGDNGVYLPEGGLDPSNPKVLRAVEEKTKEIVFDWGYELIKHDFSTYDIFNLWGRHMGTALTNDEVHFYNRGLTTAEIIVNLYRTILSSAGGKALILGCNCVSHLCAGLVHINRTGDDTSGREWSRTRAYGVNTVAFRLCQNRSFYMADADCVGIIPGAIDWELNYRWATLLANSGSPFFISCADGSMNEQQERQMRELYLKASLQTDTMEPVDWLYNNIPSEYIINNEKKSFNWYSV